MTHDVVLCGDVRTLLSALPDQSVHCCVTSPPYWGLRDYGTATWEGGVAACDHRKAHDMSTTGLGGGTATTMTAHYYRTTCGKCSARRIDAQLGLEATPGEYVAAMVAVFHEVKRVLRNDGTLWLNLGDSYCADVRKGRADMGVGKNSAHNVWFNRASPGLKPKDLVGIPWRVAFALQADGWYLRSDIIWQKPNPMPESVIDRPTKSHEYIFLLTKSATYYYDHEAIKEQAKPESASRYKYAFSGAPEGRQDPNGHERIVPEGMRAYSVTRNRRTVWTVNTRPFKGAHFATFPPDLIRPCVLAGAPAGGVVLDPFFGAGTTGVVAKELGRHYVGVELNPTYAAMAEARIAGAAVPA